MAKKQDDVKTVVWVFWILIAIIGVSVLYAGIQNALLKGDLNTSILMICFGIILVFIGLIMVVGKANIIANDLKMPGSKDIKKNENKE